MKTILPLIIAASMLVSTASALTLEVSAPADGAFAKSISTSIPTAGEYETNPLTQSIFQNLTGGNLGRSVYKVGHFNSGNANYWGADSQLAQTITLDIAEVSEIPGTHGSNARIRIGRSNDGSATQYFYQDWVDLDVGVTTLSLDALAWDKQIIFQLDGGIVLNSFTHSYGSTTESLTVVPEPSTYALLAGFAAFLFVAIKRRK